MNLPTAAASAASSTTVYTLRNATVELQSRRRCNQKRTDVGGATSEPVDILGIVTEQYQPRRVGECCVRIVDASSTTALVTLKQRSNNNDSIIKIGDIIRFNRVSLQSLLNHPHYANDAVAHFRHDAFNNPEAGPEWFRLGHVHHSNGRIINQPSLNSDTFPPSMLTDEATLTHLVDWYLASDHFQARPQVLSQLPHQSRSLEEMLSCVGITGEIMVHVVELVVEKDQDDDSSSSQVAATSSRKRRHRTPCFFQKVFAILSDTSRRKGGIINSSGERVLGTFVLYLDDHDGANTTTTTTSRTSKHVVFAKLRRAHDLKCPVRISHVQSHRPATKDPFLYASSRHPTTKNKNTNHHASSRKRRMTTATDEETVLLVATEATRVTILNDANDDDHGEDNGDDDDDHETFASTARGEAAPHSPLTCTQTTLQQQQQHQHSCAKNGAAAAVGAGTIPFEGVLVSIILPVRKNGNNNDFENTTIMPSRNSEEPISAERVVAALFSSSSGANPTTMSWSALSSSSSSSSPSSSFLSSCRLVLRSSNSSSKNNMPMGNEEVIKVQASPLILWQLCGGGGGGTSILVSQPALWLPKNTSKSTRLPQEAAASFLKALISDGIRLQWKLQPCSNNNSDASYQVNSVSLLEMPL